MTAMADAEATHSTSLISHLIELRSRLLKMVAGIAVIFIALLPFANTLFEYLSAPLQAFLPPATATMIAIDVTSPFLTPLKLSLLVSVLIALPYLLYQVWAFVAPGLYRHEQRLVFPLVLSSTVLFYAGMAFAYYLVFPLMFQFFTSVTPEGVAVATDIHRYLSFVTKIFIAFGIAFEMPIATLLLVRSGVVSGESLSRNRPYIIIGSFVLGMVLTPPDVFSQVLLALPLWGLFELGLLLARFMPSSLFRRPSSTRLPGLLLARFMPSAPLPDGQGGDKSSGKAL